MIDKRVRDLMKWKSKKEGIKKEVAYHGQPPHCMKQEKWMYELLIDPTHDIF